MEKNSKMKLISLVTHLYFFFSDWNVTKMWKSEWTNIAGNVMFSPFALFSFLHARKVFPEIRIQKLRDHAHNKRKIKFLWQFETWIIPEGQLFLFIELFSAYQLGVISKSTKRKYVFNYAHLFGFCSTFVHTNWNSYFQNALFTLPRRVTVPISLSHCSMAKNAFYQLLPSHAHNCGAVASQSHVSYCRG